MTIMTDPTHVMNQYKDDSKLTTRISLYEKYGQHPRHYTDWLHLHYDFTPGCTIVELGCGTGKDWWERMDALPHGAKLMMSDFSTGMVDRLRQRFGHHPQTEIRHLDIQSIDLMDDCADVVIANSMLYHVPDLPKAIREIRRILKPGGTFYAAGPGANEGMLGFVRRTLPNVCPDAQLPDSLTFSALNGEEILRDQFDEIAIHHYTNELAVTCVDDLVDFIYTMATLEGILPADRDRITQHYAAMMVDGVLEIDIEGALFVAR